MPVVETATTSPPPPPENKPVATPKDFVCPITSQVFDDPVTLETGQTYERRAIQEWLDRGNATCPITRQRLHGAQLPKTNYVLKRLIAAWREESPSSSSPAATPARHRATASMEEERESPAAAPPSPTMMTSSKMMGSSPSPDAASSHASAPSPTSVIALASLETAAAELRAAVSCLCTTEDLSESEAAVVKIHRLWRDHQSEPVFPATMSRPTVIHGFVEVLFNSVSANVLQVAVFLLAELASRDAAVVQTLTRVDADVDCLVALFKKGLLEAVSLIYLLAPSPEQLLDMDMADDLVNAIRRQHDDEADTPTSAVKMCVKPKAASVLLLSQLLVVLADDVDDSSSAAAVVPRAALLSDKFIRGVLSSLESDMVDEKLAAVRILLKCIGEDGHCRSSIADKAAASSSLLSALLDAFHAVGDADKIDIVRLLYDLLKLKRYYYILSMSSREQVELSDHSSTRSCSGDRRRSVF